MKRGKVFGGLVFRDHKQVRAVIYEASQARAASVAGVKLHHFRNYWSVTGNTAELEAAKARPGELIFMSQKEPET